MVELVAPVARAPWPDLDPSQRWVVRHRGPLLVTGAPGSGRTTTALAVVADRLADGALDPADALLLAPTRRAAARLRDALAGHLRRTTGEPVVRTPSSLAFSVLRARATLLGEPPPTLISGPEQDLVLAELLAGHRAGEGAAVPWPEHVPEEALGLRAFRDELRDLLMRAAERGLRPDDLALLGDRHGRPEWRAAAAVYREYLDVTQLRTGTPDAGARFDPAVVVDEAAEALLAWADEVPHAPRPSWRLVVVDDYQEATAATVRLLHVLAQDGAEVVLLADPDLAVQTFRGASPALVERASLPAGSELGAFGADTAVLERVWRHGSRLREVVAAVTAEIRGPERRHRLAPAADDGPGGAGEAEVHLVRSSAQESADAAHVLRSAHLHDGVPWHRMAVVVRSGGRVAELRRALLAARVPVETTGSDVPLRSEPAVRPLLAALACVLDPEQLAEHATTLLTSPLGGLDPVGLRRVRRALRAEELAGGGTRTSDPLLVEALADPARAATLPAEQRGPVQRLARVLAAGREALAEPGAGVLDVLWALWSATGLAETWRRSALAGGAAGARADRDLDAVLALFTAAEQFVDRLPQAPPAAFVDHLEAQALPADTLAARGDPGDAVAVLTAAGAAGLEWDVVVVAGVQEGVWPDLRLRDSMLGAAHLVEVLAGRAGDRESVAQARQAVLDDELRSFAVAASRATTRLVVTAVRDADHQASALVDLVVPATGDGPDPRLRTAPAALDLRALVARLRAAVEADPASPAAGLLAHLAARGRGRRGPGHLVRHPRGLQHRSAAGRRRAPCRCRRRGWSPRRPARCAGRWSRWAGAPPSRASSPWAPCCTRSRRPCRAAPRPSWPRWWTGAGPSSACPRAGWTARPGAARPTWCASSRPTCATPATRWRSSRSSGCASGGSRCTAWSTGSSAPGSTPRAARCCASWTSRPAGARSRSTTPRGTPSSASTRRPWTPAGSRRWRRAPGRPGPPWCTSARRR